MATLATAAPLWLAATASTLAQSTASTFDAGEFKTIPAGVILSDIAFEDWDAQLAKLTAREAERCALVGAMIDFAVRQGILPRQVVALPAAFVALDRFQRPRELAHGPQQDGGRLDIELAMRESLRDRVDRNRRVGERDELGQREVERPMPHGRRDAVQAGAQRRRVAGQGAGDHRPREVAGAVVQELFGDDGARVA